MTSAPVLRTPRPRPPQRRPPQRRPPQRRPAWRHLAAVLLPAAALAAALAACTPPAPARPVCRSAAVDSLSLRFVEGHPVVTVSINGEPVSMLLDTGAESTVVTQATAARLGLPAERERVAVSGIDGTSLQDVARATVSLTGRGRVLSLPVVNLPGGMEALAGVVGTDILSDYDLDLDEPGARVTFRHATGCTAADAAWPLPATPLAAAFTPRGRVLLPVRLGPISVQALVDTGVTDSVLSPDAARRAGVTPAQLAAAPTFLFVGAALRPVTMRTVAIDDVQIGPDRFPSLPLTVPDSELPAVNMLLGNDYLSRRRLLISWERRSVFLAAPAKP